MSHALAPLCLLLAALLAGFGLGSDAVRDAEGFYEGLVILPLAGALALGFAAFALRAGGARAALYGGLFIAGQGASLNLILCGNQVGYQHYYPLGRILLDAPPAALAVVLVELVCALVGLLRIGPALARGVRRRFSPGQLAAIGAAFVLTSSALSKHPGEYLGEVLLASAIQGLHLLTLILAVASSPPRWSEELGQRLESVLTPDPARPDRFGWLAGLWVAAVSALLCAFSYERHPHVPDEVVYLYHARYLAEGMLTMPLPAAAEAFNVDLMMYSGDVWYCPVPIGWPAMLAVGAYLGAAWLVNPILAGLTVALAHATLRGVYGGRTARLATLLMAASPWLLFLAMSFMTHVFALFAAVGASYGLMRLYRSPRHVSWAALCGAFVGVVGLIRPLEGLAAALTFGLWALAFGPLRARVRNAVVMGLAAAAVAGVQLPYNAALTGNALRFPLMLYTDVMYGDGSNALGFGENRGLGWRGLDPLPGHGPVDVAINAHLNLFQINTELHGWAIGSLLLVAIALVSGRMRRADLGLLGGALVVVFLHSFYWFSGGPDFGARYWFLTFVPGVVLSVRGLEILSRTLSPEARTRALLAVAALVLTCTAVFVPWRAVDKYHHYRAMRPDIRHLAEARAFGDALVLVRGERHPDYASAVAYNPIDLSKPVPIYAWAQGRPELRARAVRAHPERPVYIVDGPSITGRGYQVRAGPLRGIEEVERALADGA